MQVEGEGKLYISLYEEQARVHSGYAQRTLVQERVEKLAGATPISTGKPSGVMSTRKKKRKVGELNKEEDHILTNVDGYLEKFRERTENNFLEEKSKNIEALGLQTHVKGKINNKAVLRVDTGGMSNDDLLYFTMRKKQALAYMST